MLVKKKINLLAPMLCKCGCGEEVNPGKTYKQGHNAVLNKGKHRSEKAKLKISLAHKGQIPWIKGKHHTEKTKRKIGLSSSIALKGKHLTKEHKRKISIARKGQIPWSKGKHHSRATKLKISLSHKRLWRNPTFAKEMFAKFSLCRPTRPEKQLYSLLNRLFPGEYKYVGDGDVWIGGKNPDFINVNGQKKIIELFGDYWHGQAVTGMSRRQHREERQALFATHGYQVLVIWQHELENRAKVKKKLKAFHRGKLQ